MDNLDQATVELARELIKRVSVSPEDGGCQTLIADHLSALGFTVEHLLFEDVSNLWAVRGDGQPILAFAGHTDVVPPGPLEAWHTPPFDPTIDGNMLYGRGAADMKGSLAAMLTAASRFVAANPDHVGSLAFLITSDEEADAVNGTRRVIETLQSRGEVPTWAVVGEPSSDKRLGDVVRIGRRGSLGAELIVHGVQGHVAYPDDADNPIHAALPALAELACQSWDAGNEHFPATTMQISNIHAGTGANNVIPGSMELLFNFRFSTESTAESLQHRVHEILDRHSLNYDITWSLSGNPFLTNGQTLISAVQYALDAELGITPTLSTSGGTSDGRFICPAGSEVVELGPRNATIHKVNECVDINELTALSRVYTAIMKRLLCDPG
jgi:succinyl-diaminopimelate desuccinylase